MHKKKFKTFLKQNALKLQYFLHGLMRDMPG